MAAGLLSPGSLLVVTVCVLRLVRVSSPEHPEQVTVQPGDDVTLQCPAGTEASIIKLKWTIADLVSKRYVFFFRENRSYEHYQDPSFRGRVGLKDPEMKDGDASVILKKVTVNDTGTYECELSLDSHGQTQPVRRSVNLMVSDSSLTAGNTEEGAPRPGTITKGFDTKQDYGTMAGAIGVCVFILVSVLLLVYRKHKVLTKKIKHSLCW